MNYTALAIIITIIYYLLMTFGNVIYDIFIIQTNKLNLNYNKTGTIWFIGLIFINLLILIFILAFYYYKTHYAIGPLGPRGFPGDKGIDGIDTEGCMYNNN